LQRFSIISGHIVVRNKSCENPVKMKKILIGSLALLPILNSCSKNSDIPSCDATYDPCAIKAPQAEIDSVAGYLSAQGIHDTVKHCSGMFYKIDNPGTGRTPDICSTITIKYKGQFKSGSVFAQSNSLTYVLGQFIAGFKNGIPLIKEGGTIHLYIPPSLAYGSQTVPGIPSNSMLIYEVTFLLIQ
jgi:FKBP-type peptidyl-prolyl cis-trans isomerase FkpA